MGIVEFLRSWVKDVAIIFIIISMIEILLPNNSMKRYIDMIIGFLVIIVIISPFIKLLNKDLDFEREVFKNNIEQNQLVYKDDLNLSSIQEEQIKEIYNTKIEEEIRTLVYETTGYIVDEVNINIYEDQSSYGNIKDIELVISEEREEQEEPNGAIIVNDINKITIGKEEEVVPTIKEFDNEEEIKMLLSKNYSIPQEDIKIYLKTIGEDELSGEID